MLFEKIAFEWLKSRRISLKESTFALYRYEIQKYIAPNLGDVEVSKINRKNVEKLLENLRKSLKGSTVRNVFVVLKQILRFAEGKSLLKRVKIDFRLEKSAEKCANSLISDKNMRKIFYEATKNPSAKSLGVLLGLCCGLRIGEVCALRWRDISGGVLSVSKTLQRICAGQNRTKIVVGSAKTPASIRKIPLCGEILRVISAVSSEKGRDFVLTNCEKPMEPRTLRKFYAAFCKSRRIDGGHFHSLRHSFATACIKGGCDCKTVSEILGHSSVKTTLDLYMHSSLAEKRKCVARFARSVSPAK